MKLSASPSLINWVLKQGTFYVELAWGMFALQNVARSLIIENGKPLAPFLHNAWGASEWGAPIWIATMLCYGVLSIIAAGYGEARGNNFMVRSATALFGSLMWTAATVAVLTGDAQKVVAIGYGTVAFVAWLVAITLIVKHDFKKDNL